MKWRLAYVWWLIWGFGRWIWHAEGGDWDSPLWYWGGSRTTSWYPLRCACGWRGPERWAKHEYQGTHDRDVVPVNLCPQCSQELA